MPAVAAFRRLAAKGLRVLAVAERRVPDAAAVRGAVADHVTDLTLLGFIGIADPPRPTAEEAVQRLAEAGVRATMITGDHPSTATAIAAELGIPDADQVVTGAELDTMPATERLRAVQRAAVFARVSPAHKVRIVRDLRRAGRVVAMTGTARTTPPPWSPSSRRPASASSSAAPRWAPAPGRSSRCRRERRPSARPWLRAGRHRLPPPSPESPPPWPPPPTHSMRRCLASMAPSPRTPAHP